MWKKVIGPTILVSLLWIAGSSITNYYVHRVYEYHSRVMEENVSTIRAAWAMQDALWRLQAIVMEAAGKEHRETRIEATELESAFQRHLADAEKTSFTPEEKALVKAAQEHFAVYRDHIEARLQPSGLVGLVDSAERGEREDDPLGPRGGRTLPSTRGTQRTHPCRLHPAKCSPQHGSEPAFGWRS